MKKSSGTNLIRQSDSKFAKSKHGKEYCKSIPKEDHPDYLVWRLQNDPDFFFRKMLKIVTKGQILPFTPRREQKILNNIVRAMKIAKLPVRVAILKARRLGFSTDIEGHGAQETMTRPFRKATVVAHMDSAASDIFSMARTFYEELPAPLRPMTRYESKSELLFENPKNDERPKNPGLRSRFTVATARSKGVGRGAENTFLHLSEAAFYDNASDLTTGLLQTVDEREDTSIFVETTANGASGWFYDLYWGAKKGKEKLVADLVRDYEDVDKLVSHLESFEGHVGFIPLFFPWQDFDDYRLPIYSEAEKEHLKESLDEEEDRLIKEHDLDLEQIKWRRSKIESLAQTAEGVPPVELFKQEYPASDIEAFIATGRTLFDQRALADMRPRDPIFKGRLPLENPIFPRSRRYVPSMVEHPFGELTIYRSPEKGHQYAIGADTALGERGRDYSCLQVLDKRTLEQVAEWHGKIDPDQLGKFAMMLGGLYKNATVAIERNNMGLASIIALRDTRYPYIYTPKQYATKVEQPLDRLGWTTSRESKALMIANLQEAVTNRRTKINSPALISEMLAFKSDEAGRMGAEEGKHDDRVIAFAIALQCVIDYPYVSEKLTLQKVLAQQDFKHVMTTETPAFDAELGDILP